MDIESILLLSLRAHESPTRLIERIGDVWDAQHALERILAFDSDFATHYTHISHRFARLLVDILDARRVEISDTLALFASSPPPSASDAPKCIVSLRGLWKPPVWISGATEEGTVTVNYHHHWSDVGMRQWPAGNAIADILIEHPALCGTHLVELGSGIGLTSILIAKANPGLKVTATDLPSVIGNLAMNVKQNHVPNVTIQPLDWEEDAVVDNASLVIAADCVYDPSLALPLARALGKHLLHPLSRAFVLSSVRQQTTHEAFIDALKQAGLHYWRVPLQDGLACGEPPEQVPKQLHSLQRPPPCQLHIADADAQAQWQSLALIVVWK